MLFASSRLRSLRLRPLCALSAVVLIGLLAFTAIAESGKGKPSKSSKAAQAQNIQTFGDWGITCTKAVDSQTCNLAQELRRREDNGRLALFEIKPESNQRATGRLTLPFGLQLEAGVTLQVDNGPLTSRQAFSTCMPQGCLVPLQLDTAGLQTLRQGGVLKVNGIVAGGKEASLSLSLKGFDQAYARMLDMAAQSHK